MIPEKIQALFDFIDYLNDNKIEYIEKYIPLCADLKIMLDERNKLKPTKNYLDKIKYDELQIPLDEKFSIIMDNIFNPVSEKLLELDIWSGERTYASIWNNNTSAIYEFINSFNIEDLSKIMEYKNKYINFRTETNSNFLCLEIILHTLDETLKELFDFFKDDETNEFENFETKTIECKTLEEGVLFLSKNPYENIKTSFPMDFLDYKTSTAFVEKPEMISSYDEALKRVYYLKYTIEKNDGYKIFYVNGIPVKREEDLQVLLRFTWQESSFDLNREVNNGRGPVDYCVSKGAHDKTLIEFKLASNSQLKQNLQHQVKVYEQANNTQNSLTVILFFDEQEKSKVQKTLQELELDNDKNIILIDAGRKTSASKVR